MSSNPSYMSEDEFVAYLAKHNITDIKKKVKDDGEVEIYFPCPFKGCDDDRRPH